MFKSEFKITFWLNCVMILTLGYGCNNKDQMLNKEIQLTFDPAGHTIHNTQVFSPDDEWIAFDNRNNENSIGSTSTVGMVNVKTKQIQYLYNTENQTIYGPGVGAVTFSPREHKVLFIHGIRNASQTNPYGFTRRSGVAIDVKNPFSPIFMDARDITPPFTRGALRGGTHAHSWSGDGQWISFTYNDFIVEQLAKKDSAVKDLRTIGVMVPGKVDVKTDLLMENHSGEMFSMLIVPVTENPVPGSDEIDKAFDEGWIGEKGYIKESGERQKRAIAFQGNTRNNENQTLTQVFVADLPENLLSFIDGVLIEGTEKSRPEIPKSISVKKITNIEKGILGPRFWLRSTPDGNNIGFLSSDSNGVVQIFGVNPANGKIKQLTYNEFPVQGPFNFCPKSRYLTYCAENRVYITDLKTGKSLPLTPPADEKNRPIGAPVFSNDGKMIAYNKYVSGEKGNFVQIFSMRIVNE